MRCRRPGRLLCPVHPSEARNFAQPARRVAKSLAHFRRCVRGRDPRQARPNLACSPTRHSAHYCYLPLNISLTRCHPLARPPACVRTTRPGSQPTPRRASVLCTGYVVYAAADVPHTSRRQPPHRRASVLIKPFAWTRFSTEKRRFGELLWIGMDFTRV